MLLLILSVSYCTGSEFFMCSQVGDKRFSQIVLPCIEIARKSKVK